MKLRQKVLISLCFTLSLGLAALSACADQAGQEPGASPSSGLEVAAVLTVETEDAVAGLHFEYVVDGTLTGGLMVQPQTVFSLGETVTAAFPLDPERPPVRDSVPFGLYLAVVAENGTQFPVPVYCQWEADLETPCTLTLQGSKTVGYTLSADGKSPVLTLTPYSQLSQDQIPF